MKMSYTYVLKHNIYAVELIGLNVVYVNIVIDNIYYENIIYLRTYKLCQGPGRNFCFCKMVSHLEKRHWLNLTLIACNRRVMTLEFGLTMESVLQLQFL